VIEIESSLSAFVRRIRGFQHGREIRFFKDQLTRISNGSFRFAVETATGPEQTNAYIMTEALIFALVQSVLSSLRPDAPPPALFAPT
jgi:hypothetical protein